jgi:ABC-2 type transport system ATP-binding protein
VNRVIELDMGKVVLDDRVAEDVNLTSLLQARITVRRADAALAKALAGWQFVDRGEGLLWEGLVAGADRLRFLGMISRYAGLVSDLQLTEQVPS